MSDCECFNPDNVFKKFKVLEFPISFVGLSTARYLDVETNLDNAAFLKTMCNGSLLQFPAAREISASHRAFTITQINDHTVQITFNPKNECISNAKHQKVLDNRFVFDLRLFQVDGTRCCSNELHSEIGRYYISGQFEYLKLSNYPNVTNFGEVVMNTRITKQVRIRNESNMIATKIEYVRVTGFEVVPSKFLIPPNSTKCISITIKPTCLKMKNSLSFEVRNPHSIYDDNFDISVQDQITDDNFISYTIICKFKVIYKKKTRDLVIESMHKLNEPNTRYTFIDEADIIEHKQRREEAYKHLQICKSNYVKKNIIEKFCTGRDKCYSDLLLKPRKQIQNFCKTLRGQVDTYSLFDIVFLPFLINFGMIGLNTYGKQELIIKNKTKYDFTIKLHNDKYIFYTEEKHKSLFLKVKSFCESKIVVLCLGLTKGSFKGTFEYIIDNRFNMKHRYSLAVAEPTLLIQEKSLKFGMTTSESFITSVPVRIHNYFNIPVQFKWEELQSDLPFEIIPNTGLVREHSGKICDVIYICKPTKTKSHEVNFVSLNNTMNVVPIELSIVTRKLTIKFLQASVYFKDIALNIKTIERVKLENSSREIATFFVVEPLIPGLKIEPMTGNIRPKMVITFEIIVKMSCILEFAFDVTVKINNKENITIPISGNVVEPKILIYPKNIFMSRIPSYMTTYVPVTFQNISTIKTEIKVLDTGDKKFFDVYIAQGNDKQRIFEFVVEGGQSKTVFIKVFDIFRREYDMYIPFKINGLLGPPDQNSRSTELQYYIGEYETQYEHNPRVKIKSLNKDISFCRIIGVITVPWIHLSVNKFEIEYVPNGSNKIDFTLTNISKYYLHITILTSKLSPIFTLNLHTEENQSIINESHIKFELDCEKKAAFSLIFHPKMHGVFVSTALLFLDKHMATPYYNLTFVGKRQNPAMTPSTYRVIFPPCYVGMSMVRTLTVKMGFAADFDDFSCTSKEEENLNVKFIGTEVTQEHDITYTVLTVEIKVCSQTTYARHITILINHACGSSCEIEITFCFTYCPITLHTNLLVTLDDNPYPYFPTSNQSNLYDYMTSCTQFLEKWMFQQGFRRELYPVIPDTFHAISTALSSQPLGGTKAKSISVSYLNFMRRIAGPMMKHIHKMTALGVEEPSKSVIEIHDTYKSILNMIKARGADLWTLQAKFLLSYNQFVIYTEYVTPKCNADIIFTRELLEDVNLFNRLSKQSWFDFILQSYKVFVMDSCFFDCVCVSSLPRDIVKVLIDWYNEQILLQNKKLLGAHRPVKQIKNLTSDLSDGIAVTSAILSYCPFLVDHFALFSEIDDEKNKDGGIINNACLIIEVMNQLRIYFPLTSKDFIKPIFLQMVFFSIHLYVVLPMFKPRDIIKFSPPLLRSSTRHVGVSSASQESLIFTYIILTNSKSNFSVEKGPSGDNGKKIYLSVKYVANFVNEENGTLLVHGYNKTRIFDTYVVFLLKGCVGVLTPLRKCKVIGPLYRPIKVDVQISSPFPVATTFKVFVTDTDPSIPVVFEHFRKPKFYLQRLNLVDTDITLPAMPKESGQEVIDHKLYLQLICLSTQVGNSWIWFRSEIGEFFVRVTTQPRWDLATDTLQANVQNWPMDPCSCGECCECYRTTLLMIPHRNELMVKSLRYALIEHASDVMMGIFDELIETITGRIILGMLLAEGGTNMSEIQHILLCDVKYRISSKSLIPRLERAVLEQHTPAMLPLPVTVPPRDKSDKYTVTLTSECGSDIRTYRILFVESTCHLLPSS